MDSKLEQESIAVLRKARNDFKNLAILKTRGAESQALFALCERAFFKKMPFWVIEGLGALKEEVKEHNFEALILPMREEIAESQNGSERIYPLINWTDSDIKEYLSDKKIALNINQEKEKEETMKRLRELGYL